MRENVPICICINVYKMRIKFRTRMRMAELWHAEHAAMLQHDLAVWCLTSQCNAVYLSFKSSLKKKQLI